MRKTAAVTIALLLGAVAAGLYWQALKNGLVPPRWSPVPPLDLTRPVTWYVDLQLSALRQDPELCRRVMVRPEVDATAIPDRPIAKGCGWRNAVNVRSAGGAAIGAEKLTCETAAALALWMAHDVQPAAMKHFGTRIRSVRSFGTYSCRDIAGDPGVRSEHATANAIDIAGFTLGDETEVSLARHWSADVARSAVTKASGAETDKVKARAAFLRDIHKSACRVFATTIGPDYDDDHDDHFHLDRAAERFCR